jgi:RNase H-fold protein (predicted Holliday junction resolvase)
MAEPTTVLAIDPGRSKCGIAVVTGGTEPEVLHRAVVPTDQITQILTQLSSRHRLDVILIGNGTTASQAAEAAQNVGVPVELVDERLTSVEARKRYFAENPPRGLRRLIPASLQTPGQPVDDYVAVILAERYLHLISDL